MFTNWVILCNKLVDAVEGLLSLLSKIDIINDIRWWLSDIELEKKLHRYRNNNCQVTHLTQICMENSCDQKSNI